MSWCRWGSKCHDGVYTRFVVDALCVDCPGSDLYIYRSDEGIVCADCGTFETEAAMDRHLLEHAERGDHVRASLLAVARHETAGEMFPAEIRFQAHSHQKLLDVVLPLFRLRPDLRPLVVRALTGDGEAFAVLEDVWNESAITV